MHHFQGRMDRHYAAFDLLIGGKGCSKYFCATLRCFL